MVMRISSRTRSSNRPRSAQLMVICLISSSESEKDEKESTPSENRKESEQGCEQTPAEHGGRHVKLHETARLFVTSTAEANHRHTRHAAELSMNMQGNCRLAGEDCFRFPTHRSIVHTAPRGWGRFLSHGPGGVAVAGQVAPGDGVAAVQRPQHHGYHKQTEALTAARYPEIERYHVPEVSRRPTLWRVCSKHTAPTAFHPQSILCETNAHQQKKSRTQGSAGKVTAEG